MNMLIRFLWNQFWKSNMAGRLIWLLLMGGVGAGSWVGVGHLRHRFGQEHCVPAATVRYRDAYEVREREERGFRMSEPDLAHRPGFHRPEEHREERNVRDGWRR